MRKIIRFPDIITLENYTPLCYKHDVDAAFDDKGPVKDFQRVIDTGVLTRACFDHLASSSDESPFSSNDIRGFLISFGLATPVEDQECLYIPSLIRDNNKSFVMSQLKQMQRDKISLGLLFKCT